MYKHGALRGARKLENIEQSQYMLQNSPLSIARLRKRDRAEFVAYVKMLADKAKE